jgi:hypothetical protein
MHYANVRKQYVVQSKLLVAARPNDIGGITLFRSLANKPRKTRKIAFPTLSHSLTFHTAARRANSSIFSRNDKEKR